MNPIRIVILLSFAIFLLSTTLVTCDESMLDLDVMRTMEQVLQFPNFDQDNVNVECRNQYAYLRDHAPNALTKMDDAWSKLYPGLFYATKLDFGNYDECISIDVTNTETMKSILGKYCGGIIIPTLSNEVFTLVYCVPEACGAADLNIVATVTVNTTVYNGTLPFYFDTYCSTKETNTVLDAGAIASLTIFGLFILIVVVSTAYDVLLYLEKRKTPNPLFTAFSFYTNGKKLFTVSKLSNAQIQCFHGMKFIGMWWIIAGHNALGWGSLPVVNADLQSTWQHSRRSLYITRTHLAVDTFFYISGFLLAYSYFKRKSVPTKIQIFQIPAMIRHRYLRLTPAVLMTYLFSTFLLKYCADGPVWESQTTGDKCREYWWSTFLYIENYTNRKDMCIVTLWYLCVDMQLFVLAPIVLIPISMLYRKSLKTALSALAGLNLFFIALPIFTKLMWRDYDASFDEYDTHSRFTDYYIGIAMGLYMIAVKPKPYKIPLYLNIVAWFTVIAAMFAVIFITEEAFLFYGYVGKSITYSLTRPVWCLGLCWITYVCVTGNGGIINWILSNGFMQVGGKLTYCLYLVHGAIVALYLYQDRIRWYYSDFNFFYLWCGHFIFSLIIGTFWHLAFEQPLVTVERVLFGPKPKKPVKIEAAGQTTGETAKEDIAKIS